MRALRQLAPPVPAVLAEPPGDGRGGGGGSDAGKIIGIVVGLVAFIIIKTCIIAFFYMRHKRKKAAEKKFMLSRNPAGLQQYTVEALKMWGWDLAKNEVRLLTHEDGSLCELGEGSYGRVVLGIRNEVQHVAVKMLSRSNDSKAKQAFEREVEMLKYTSLDKHIVQFYGACTLDNGDFWLVTEFMEGGELRHALTRDVPPPVTWWNGGKFIALDVVRCLAFLHAQNLIHRDLKSSNILLTKEGMAKVADFGLAKVMEHTHLTSDSAVGTFAFMAPEILLGQRCTEKVDIYAYGVVLWEIATGSLPLRGAMHLPLDPRREGPPELSSIIEACMQPNADLRPSATDLYRRLQECPPSYNKTVDMLLDSDETLLTTLPTSTEGRGTSSEGRDTSTDHGSSPDGSFRVTLVPDPKLEQAAYPDHFTFHGPKPFK